MRLFIPIILCILALSLPVKAQVTKLTYFQTDARYDYRIALLRLVMELTRETHGDFELLPYHRKISPNRALALMENEKDINIAFLPVSADRERRFLSVKKPLLQGILGYRIFITRNDLQKQFAQIRSLEQLRTQFIAGFGIQWSDMAILKGNQIPVVGALSYNNLFTMLDNDRFQYFPRGINEPWLELATRDYTHPNLVVEKTLGFYYPNPVYFYTRKNDKALAERLAIGLDQAIENGQFKALFLAYHQSFIDKARMSQRRIFKLKNHTLPDGISPPDTSWWLPEKTTLLFTP